MHQTNSIESVQLPIMEQFYSIQGEGFYSGRPAYFIRLGGCDVGCVWCDVKESWDKNMHPHVEVHSIVESALNVSAKFAVITGGEPAMHDLELLVKSLQNKKIEVAIETSGCYPIKPSVDWYCFSPKKFKNPIEEAYEKADELKVIIYHRSDFDWAIKHAAKVSSKCKLYLQPEWSKEAQILPEIISFTKANPTWHISLQTHKYMNIQ